MQRRDGRLNAYMRLSRIYADREIIKRYLYYVVTYLLGVAPVICKCLIVCYKYINIVKFSRVLQLNPAL